MAQIPKPFRDAEGRVLNDNGEVLDVQESIMTLIGWVSDQLHDGVLSGIEGGSEEEAFEDDLFYMPWVLVGEAEPPYDVVERDGDALLIHHSSGKYRVTFDRIGD